MVKESSWDTLSRVNMLIDFITVPGNQQFSLFWRTKPEKSHPRNLTKATVCSVASRA